MDPAAEGSTCVRGSLHLRVGPWILVALGSPTMLRALLLLALCALAQCYVVGTAPTALRPLARAPAAVTMEEQPFAVFSKIPTPALFATFGGAAMVRARPARK